MKLSKSVAELQREHVVLELECIDRMYLNAYVPQLTSEAGPRAALLLRRSLSVGRKAIASLSANKHGPPYFSARNELQNIP
jgi:hypothetical protein